jgi:hypothetical protein
MVVLFRKGLPFVGGFRWDIGVDLIERLGSRCKRFFLGEIRCDDEEVDICLARAGRPWR